MRPDPYKQERSKKYLAKQRVKYGASSSTKGTGPLEEKKGIPRWIKNLPSNRDRYEQVAGASSEEEDKVERYDYDQTQDLQALVDAFNNSVFTSEKRFMQADFDEPACPLYESCTEIDTLSLSKIVRESVPCLEELHELPLWYLNHVMATQRSCKKGFPDTSDDQLVQPASTALSSHFRLTENLKNKKVLHLKKSHSELEEAKTDVHREVTGKTDLETWLDDVI